MTNQIVAELHEQINTPPETSSAESVDRPDQPAADAPMVEWALYYARHGLRVVPGHTPLFDNAGQLTGCSCEAYKRSEKYHKWLIEKGRGREFDPAYKCPTPGKHPRFANWQDRATGDEKTIRTWWKWWPDANVGHNPGRAEFGPDRRPLMMLDGDTYKDTYEGSALALPTNTPTALTGNLGEHDYFYMPRDKTYGQHTGDLPAGIDIRGLGGYDILPPSLHYSGRRYQWEADLSFDDLEPLELPAHVIDLIESHDGRKGEDVGPSDIEAVQRSTELVEALLQHAAIDHAPAQSWGDGRRYILHDCPFNPPDDPHGADGASFIVVYQDGRIGAGCHHNRCQHVIQDSGLSGWAFLKARVGVTSPTTSRVAPSEFDEYSDFVQSARGTATLKDTLASSQVEGPRGLMVALLFECRKKGSYAVELGRRFLGERCGMTGQAVTKLLGRLAAAGWLEIENPGRGKRWIITLRPCSSVATLIDLPLGEKVATFDQGRDFYRRNRPDDAYLRNHAAYKKRRLAMDLSEGTPSMGPAALLVAAHLRAYGQMSRTQLQTSTGLGQGAVTMALRRLTAYGQIEVVATGPRGMNIYAVAASAAETLEALRPGLRTDGVGIGRKIQNFELVLARWKQTYPNRHSAPDDVRRKLNWMEAHLEKLVRKHPATAAYLTRRKERQGIDERAGVAHNVRYHRRWREDSRWDHGEVWASTHKPVYEEYQRLAPRPHGERVRVLHFAGWTDGEINAAILAAGRRYGMAAAA